MDDAVWNEIIGNLAGSDDSAVEEAATEAATPETNDPPTNDATEETPVLDTAPVSEAVAPVTTPPVVDKPNWDTPENPHFQEAQVLRQLREAAAAEAQRVKVEQIKNGLVDLADGDSERLQQINGILTQVTTPLIQRAQAFEQRAVGTEKALAAMVVAMKSALDEEQIKVVFDEHQHLMSVEGVETMERLAYGKRDMNRQFQAELSKRDQQIEELRRQIASQGQLAQRQASGADLVDGGTGGIPNTDFTTQMREAQDMDTYMDAFFQRTRAA